MKDELSVTYVGIDVSKDKLAVAVADGAPGGEVVSWGTFENAPASVHTLLRKLANRAALIRRSIMRRSRSMSSSSIRRARNWT